MILAMHLLNNKLTYFPRLIKLLVDHVYLQNVPFYMKWNMISVGAENRDFLH